MNKQTVGMENLPNVYIESINVLQKNYRFYQVRVTVVMYDDQDNPTWRNKIDGLKIKCSLIRDDRISSLNSGELSLYDIQDGRPFTLVDSCDELTKYKIADGYGYYQKIFEFSVGNPQNLNVYVSTFIDDLGFGISQFDKFYGPMSAERIFVGGQLNTESGYFYYPDTNEEYGGPVHTHNQGYMEGSEHSDEPHSRLVYVPEENFKITTLQQMETFDPSGVIVNGDGIIDFGETDPSSQTMDNPNFVPESLSGPGVPTRPGVTTTGGY